MTLDPGDGGSPRRPHTSISLHERAAGQPLRVAVVDLDRRVQAALAEALRVAGLDVIGTAGELGAALALIANGTDVLVLDPRLPELADGHALVRTVAREWPQVRVVIMGWGDTGESPMHDHAVAFVTKSARAEEFVAATLAACGC
jgi:DNA-binding NtrC family response regulator